MSTTGNVSVGGTMSVSGNSTISGNETVTGKLTVSGGSVTPTWSVPDSPSATNWMLLGTWTTSQNGESLYMRVVAHVGYNAASAQNQVTELSFVTSNNSSYIDGSTGNYYANGLASVNSRLGTGGSNPYYLAPQYFRIVQVSVTSYQIYAYFGGSYMGKSNYTVQIGPATTWTDSSTLTSPSGNYITITPTTY
jgi:hypothetical protein